MYCTECIIGIIQSAGTPSRLRFARTRRDEGRRERQASNYGSRIPPRILTVNRIPYRIWLATSHQEVETKISFPLFRGNGSWCRISRIQSSSHHIISELKSSPPQAI